MVSWFSFRRQHETKEVKGGLIASKQSELLSVVSAPVMLSGPLQVTQSQIRPPPLDIIQKKEAGNPPSLSAVC